MNIALISSAVVNPASDCLLLISDTAALPQSIFADAEINYIKTRKEAKDRLVRVNRFDSQLFVLFFDETKPESARLEAIRKEASKVAQKITKLRIATIQVTGNASASELLAACEGLILASYEFVKYLSKGAEKASTLQQIEVISDAVNPDQLAELINLSKAVYMSRDLVNEPASYLNATRFAEYMRQMGKQAGFDVEVLEQDHLVSLKMGGLLAVNKGSTEPATFTVMEYKSAEAKNPKPIVLVGKGLVYDSGGLSLKPTPDSMDYMKCDMAGGALVASLMYAIAKNKLPLHVIALVPATDNRLDANSYAPGDVITMHNGTTVEVLNTDAEGRLILADALSYAQKYEPQQVFNFATLTGAAAQAIGSYGMVVMGTAPDDTMMALKAAGDKAYERIAPFPFWDEYGELLKSDIADLKNIGGPKAGAITAGKFLEKFTNYPFVHFDIAGVAFFKTTDSYRKKGGTGYGVRMMYNYFKTLSEIN